MIVFTRIDFDDGNIEFLSFDQISSPQLRIRVRPKSPMMPLSLSPTACGMLINVVYNVV